MTVETKLGKIEKVRFGGGGYQDAMIGASFTLSGDGWGVQDFWGSWSIERYDNCKWTDAERLTQLGVVVMRIHRLLFESNRTDFGKLPGTPIEATFHGNVLKSWRVLTEVI